MRLKLTDRSLSASWHHWRGLTGGPEHVCLSVRNGEAELLVYTDGLKNAKGKKVFRFRAVYQGEDAEAMFAGVIMTDTGGGQLADWVQERPAGYTVGITEASLQSVLRLIRSIC